MIRFFIFSSIFFLISCKGNNDKSVIILENEDIEVYNFSELKPLLSKVDDITYVVNFWATWCAPCVKELPYFQELNETYKSEKVKVLLVSLDFPDKFETQLIPFVKKNNLIPQVILLDDPDENGWIPKVDKSWSGALPATLIYNKNKRKFYQQPFTKESLFKEVNTFIKG